MDIRILPAMDIARAVVSHDAIEDTCVVLNDRRLPNFGVSHVRRPRRRKSSLGAFHIRLCVKDRAVSMVLHDLVPRVPFNRIGEIRTHRDLIDKKRRTVRQPIHCRHLKTENAPQGFPTRRKCWAR
jgi:hypothetical protein